MRELSFQPDKKLRGLKRRFAALRRWVQDFDGCFPDGPEPDWIWHVHLPVHQNLVTGRRAGLSTKRTVLGALLDACQAMRRAKPKNAPDARVVAVLVLPYLWHSTLDVFFEEDEYLRFINRRGPEQVWTPLPGNRSLIREWQLPYDMCELGFHEEIHDEDVDRSGEVWLIGDVQ